MNFLFRSPIAVLPLLVLSACAASVGSFPSLAPRPAEQAGAATPSPEIAAAAAVDPALNARAAALSAQAERGGAAMDAASRGACTAIARSRGAREGSEAWIAGQQSLSVVEAARRDTVAAREGIDALVLEQARLAQDQPRPLDLSVLLAAAEKIAALDAAQEARLLAMREGRCGG